MKVVTTALAVVVFVAGAARALDGDRGATSLPPPSADVIRSAVAAAEAQAARGDTMQTCTSGLRLGQLP